MAVSRPHSGWASLSVRRRVSFSRFVLYLHPHRFHWLYPHLPLWVYPDLMFVAYITWMTLSTHILQDIIALSEMWLNTRVDDSVVTIPGFSVFRAGRHGHGGGVALLASENRGKGVQVNSLQIQQWCKCELTGDLYHPQTILLSSTSSPGTYYNTWFSHMNLQPFCHTHWHISWNCWRDIKVCHSGWPQHQWLFRHLSSC